jgi:hypothetical protein
MHNIWMPSIFGYPTSFCLGMVVYFFIRKYIKANMFSKDTKKRQLLFYTGDLLFIGGSYAVSLWAIFLSGSGDMMSPCELYFIKASAFGFSFLVVFLFGTIAALFVDMYIDARRERIKDKRNEEIRLTAFHIWEQEGHPTGKAFEHWARAEAEWEKQNKYK